MSKEDSQVSRMFREENIQEEIVKCSYKSERVDIHGYVHDKICEYKHSIPELLRIIRNGDFIRTVPEQGNFSGYGFTVVFKLIGDADACFISGWYDQRENNIILDDFKKCAYISE